MNTTILIIACIAFIIVGAILSTLSFIFKEPKSASRLFLIVGSITLVMGIMGLIMHSELTKAAVQLAGLIYLVLLIIAMVIFTTMTKGTYNETDSSQR